MEVTPPFSVLVREVRGVPVVKVHGEVCLAASAGFGAALDQAMTTALREGGEGVVVVDLGEVEFMDSSGLTLLLHASREFRGGGGKLRVVIPPGGPVARLLDLTGLDEVLVAYQDADSAVADDAEDEAASP